MRDSVNPTEILNILTYLSMAMDIVFPSGNEMELAELEKKLGCPGILMLYDFGKTIPKMDFSLNVRFGIVCRPSEVQKARKQCDFVAVRSSDRSVIEKFKPDMIFDFENEDHKDGLHARKSGLNHVLCSIMAKNRIVMGISFRSLLLAGQRPRLLGRMMQNVSLCKKYKVGMILASFAQAPYELRNPKDLDALSRVLGIPQSLIPRW